MIVFPLDSRKLVLIWLSDSVKKFIFPITYLRFDSFVYVFVCLYGL